MAERTSQKFNQRRFDAIFLEIPGKSLQSTGVDDVSQAPHRPGYRVVENFDQTAQDIARSDASLHLQAYDGIVNLIKDLSPIVAIVDMLFYPEEDACQSLKIPFIRLSQTTSYESLMNGDPRLSLIWKYPL